MFDRLTFPAAAMNGAALLLCGLVGCGDVSRNDDGVTPGAVEQQQRDAEATVEEAPRIMEESEVPPAPVSEDDAIVETEADEEEPGTVIERNEERIAADKALAENHHGAWIIQGGRLHGSKFIFIHGGRAQMGADVMMFSGEYTIDYNNVKPHLFIRVDAMGRIVDTHFFVEYLPDDRLRFYPVVQDPDAPGGVRLQEGAESMVLVRDE
jgi:hypothetical protein